MRWFLQWLEARSERERRMHEEIDQGMQQLEEELQQQINPLSREEAKARA